MQGFITYVEKGRAGDALERGFFPGEQPGIYLAHPICKADGDYVYLWKDPFVLGGGLYLDLLDEGYVFFGVGLPEGHVVEKDGDVMALMRAYPSFIEQICEFLDVGRTLMEGALHHAEIQMISNQLRGVTPQIESERQLIERVSRRVAERDVAMQAIIDDADGRHWDGMFGFYRTGEPVTRENGCTIRRHPEVRGARRMGTKGHYGLFDA